MAHCASSLRLVLLCRRVPGEAPPAFFGGRAGGHLSPPPTGVPPPKLACWCVPDNKKPEAKNAIFAPETVPSLTKRRIPLANVMILVRLTNFCLRILLKFLHFRPPVPTQRLDIPIVAKSVRLFVRDEQAFNCVSDDVIIDYEDNV